MLELIVNNIGAETQADLELLARGSLWLMKPLTNHGAGWMAANVEGTWPKTLGGVAIDYRHIDSVVDLAVYDNIIIQTSDELPGVNTESASDG